MRGEEVLACIVSRGASRRPEVAAASRGGGVEADLSYFKVPGWVAFVEALPLTATNKIQRGEVKAKAAGAAGHAGLLRHSARSKRTARQLG